MRYECNFWQPAIKMFGLSGITWFRWDRPEKSPNELINGLFQATLSH